MQPDHEAIMDEVHTLASEARASGARQDEVKSTPKTNSGVIAPIFMGTSPVVPERYVVHYAETTCKSCGSTVRDSEFFALSYLRSRINGSRVRHLTRCTSPEFNLPVDVIRTGTHTIPFCCECIAIDLSHLPPPPQAALVYDLAEPRLKGAKPPKAKEVKPATKATLDDLA